MPAIYVIAPLSHFWTYTGDKPWTRAPIEDHTADMPRDVTRDQFRANATESWAAWTLADGFGLTFFQPDTEKCSAGNYYPGHEPDLKDLARDDSWGHKDETHYWAGWKTVNLDKDHRRIEYDLYVIVGNVGDARAIIASKLKDAPKLRTAPAAPAH
jgi:hypothetical protein